MENRKMCVQNSGDNKEVCGDEDMGKTEYAGGMTENKKISAWRWRDGNESKICS
jgi:hypothetical protein